MKHLLRRASVGAVAFLATAAFAAPAFAADPADLELLVGGTTLALGADAKEPSVTIKNNGPGVANGYKLTIDTSALDATKVKLVFPNPADVPICDAATKTCTSTQQVGPGENFDFTFFKLERQAGATSGSAGSITVKVSSETEDPKADNNTVKVDVTLNEVGGPDLRALVPWDIVTFEADGKSRPAYPGEETEFIGIAFNQGSQAAPGWRATVKLPEGVTFIGNGEEEGCVYSDGNTKAVCEYANWEVKTGGNSDDGATWVGVVLPVKISSTVAAPVNIPGGVFTADPIAATPSLLRSAPKTFTLPANVSPDNVDADPSDNSDDFTAYVGKPGGQGGGLPVTGANIAVIGGAGVAVLLAGGVLFLVTRRRRVTV